MRRRGRIAAALAAALSLGGCLTPVENAAVNLLIPEIVAGVLNGEGSEPDGSPPDREEP